MAHMLSIEFTEEEKQQCHQLARDAIAYGLEHDDVMPIDITDYAVALQQKRACFVTLHLDGALRGCVGSLFAYRPLANDIVGHAYTAAFRDPRFAGVTADELPALDIEISVLGEPEPMQFDNEADLLQQLQPGKDGLVLEFGNNKGTFLPSVWEQLPDRKEFLDQLKLKANLPPFWWDDAVKISRYETVSF